MKVLTVAEALAEPKRLFVDDPKFGAREQFWETDPVLWRNWQWAVTSYGIENVLTRDLFNGSKWAGDMGAGVWAGALRQSPRGTIHDVAKARVNGDVQPATLISLEGLYGESGIMKEREGGE